MHQDSVRALPVSPGYWYEQASSVSIFHRQLIVCFSLVVPFSCLPLGDG